MDENQQQIEALQEAYNEGSSMTLVMDAFSRYQNSMREVAVDVVWKRVGKTSIKRSEIVRVLKQLEEMGFGTYIKGAHGYASRFTFAHRQGPLRLAMLASSEGAPNEDDLPDSFEEEPGLSPMSGQEDEELDHDGIPLATHTFLLRAGRQVSISLPENLTTRESKRLALWMKSLPFNCEQDVHDFDLD